MAGGEPDAALPGFWERCWTEAETRAQHGPAVLLLDEIHHLPDWAVRLKGQWDRLRRRRLPLHVVATGSSALRVATVSRESLAGRGVGFQAEQRVIGSLAAIAGIVAHLSPFLMTEYGEHGAVEIEDETRAVLRQVNQPLEQSIIGGCSCSRR